MQARGQAMAEEFRGKGVKSVLYLVSFLVADIPLVSCSVQPWT